MTTEMQEIAITEEKPLLPGQSDAVKVTHTHAHSSATCCTFEELHHQMCRNAVDRDYE